MINALNQFCFRDGFSVQGSISAKLLARQEWEPLYFARDETTTLLTQMPDTLFMVLKILRLICYGT